MSSIDTAKQMSEGVAAVKAGNKKLGFTLLSPLVMADPENALAWLWLSGAVESAAEQKFCLEQAITRNPNLTVAVRGLASLPPDTTARSPLLNIEKEANTTVSDAPITIPTNVATTKPSSPVAIKTSTTPTRTPYDILADMVKIILWGPKKSTESTAKPTPNANRTGGCLSWLIVGFAIYLTLSFLWPSKAAKPVVLITETAIQPTQQPAIAQSIVTSDITTNWKLTSRGMTAADGELWVPEVRLMVENKGTDDVASLYYRIVFTDGDGVIKGDDAIESVTSLPAGRTKGPIIINGSLGFTLDVAFIPMMKDPSEKWQYDLYIGDNYSGPWKKLQSGVVELPPEYR